MSDMRDRVRKLFTECLGAERHARALELCTFNVVHEQAKREHVDPYWENVAFRKLYSVKARSMLFNLNNPATPNLKQTLLTATDVEPFRKLVRMTHAEMYPALWQPHFDALKKKGKSTEPVPEGQIQCGKCKSWRCSFTLLQTRSADEPATCYCYCDNCGKRWKMAA